MLELISNTLEKESSCVYYQFTELNENHHFGFQKDVQDVTNRSKKELHLPRLVFMQ